MCVAVAVCNQQAYRHAPTVDLRVYVLVTSCDPLRAFMFNDGLVRMSTTKYHAPTSDNIDQLFMHLTNYSLNKHSETFDDAEGEGEGSKRTIRWLNEWLAANGHLRALRDLALLDAPPAPPG